MENLRDILWITAGASAAVYILSRIQAAAWLHTISKHLDKYINNHLKQQEKDEK